MEYMIRFTQVHETFRLPEIEALAVLDGIKLEVLSYNPSVSFTSIFVWSLTHRSQVTILFCEVALKGSGRQTCPKKHPCQIHF